MTSTITVTGKVSDAANKPIPGAIIMITGGTHDHPDLAAQSDTSGRFALPDLQSPGTYTLRVQHGETSKEITFDLGDTSDVLDIRL